MNERSFSLDGTLDRLTNRWYLLVIGGICGGLIGLLASHMAPPLFRAHATLSVWIDPGVTMPLDRQTEYAAYLRVQDLLLSDEILGETLRYLDPVINGGDRLATDELRDQIRLTRKGDRWEFEVYSWDREIALQIAEAWAQASMRELEEAISAAWRSHELQVEVFGLGCAPGTLVEGEPIRWQCSLDRDAQIQETLGDRFVEVQRSRGILPVFGLSLLDSASGDPQPIVRMRGALVLGGLLLGILLTTLSLLIRFRENQPEVPIG